MECDKRTAPLSHLEGDGDLDAAEVLLVRLVVARGVQVAKVKGIADGLERVSVHAGHNGTNALGSYGMPQRLMRTRR